LFPGLFTDPRREAAAIEAIGAMIIKKESRQALNILLLAGVNLIDRFISSPYGFANLRRNCGRNVDRVISSVRAIALN
jgi:hypothetical protein